MALQADGRGGFNLGLAHRQPVSHPYELRYSTNDIQRLSHAAAISGDIVSPWRVVMIGRDLNALVNCDLIHNLCPPPDPDLFPQGLNAPWLKPGRAVWKYMDGGESTIESAKEFCRLAGELGFEYNVIEGYWTHWSDDEIKDLVRYAREHGVGLWFWKHSRTLHTPEAREEFFRKLQDLGVVGAKIDFFDHEHKEVIDLYQALLADAAKHRIMVNFHGSDKPTGEARTWPNELTREAIRGMESSRLQDRATHDTTLPFTRYLAGQGDYTVLHFGARRANTTWAHQIATAAVFDMPLLTIVAHPANILTNPAVGMIKSIPPVWDQTIVLPPSEIGEVAVFARRRGDQWFLALLNGTNARTIRVPLSFLPPGKQSASLVSDRPDDPASLKIETAEVKRSDTLKIEMNSGGGFIARFNPQSAK
jgi:alpha-glucosidase